MRVAYASIAVLAAVTIALAATGCSAVQVDINGQSVNAGDAGAVLSTAKQEATAVGCKAIKTELDRRYVLASSQTLNSEVSVSFGAIVKKLGKGCPGGGAYTYDEATRSTVCSVHD